MAVGFAFSTFELETERKALFDLLDEVEMQCFNEKTQFTPNPQCWLGPCQVFIISFAEIDR